MHLGLACSKEYLAETQTTSLALPRGTTRIKVDRTQPPGNCGDKHVPSSRPMAYFTTRLMNGYYPPHNKGDSGRITMIQPQRRSCVAQMTPLPSITRVVGHSSSNRRET
jgi:hypothetical protein